MSCKPQSTVTEPDTGTVASDPVSAAPGSGRRGGVRKTPPPSTTSVDAELIAAHQNVSDSPETYGQSRAERRLRKHKPKLVAELLRQKASGSYEPSSNGWGAL
jgi:hypothetical protein